MSLEWEARNLREARARQGRQRLLGPPCRAAARSETRPDEAAADPRSSEAPRGEARGTAPCGWIRWGCRGRPVPGSLGPSGGLWGGELRARRVPLAGRLCRTWQETEAAALQEDLRGMERRAPRAQGLRSPPPPPSPTSACAGTGGDQAATAAVRVQTVRNVSKDVTSGGFCSEVQIRAISLEWMQGRPQRDRREAFVLTINSLCMVQTSFAHSVWSPRRGSNAWDSQSFPATSAAGALAPVCRASDRDSCAHHSGAANRTIWPAGNPICATEFEPLRGRPFSDKTPGRSVILHSEII